MSSVAVPRRGAGRLGRAATRRWPRGGGLVVLAGVCLLAAAWAAMVGAVPIGVADVLTVCWHGLTGVDVDVADRNRLVLLEVRFPRVALCAIVGAALALAGAAMQGLFRNPLADPALIGASSGAALAVAVTIVLGSRWLPGFTRTFGVYALPAAAFAGCLVATWLVKRLATSTRGVSVGAMLLGGVAFNALCEAGVSALTFAATDEQLRNYTFWRMGSLAGASGRMVLMAAACTAVAAGLLVRATRALNVLSLGEEAARQAGVDTEGLSRRVVIASALLVGASVASAGLVWFVGLVAPHLVRLAGGADHRWVLPGAALLGAALALAADAVARTLVMPSELPLGVPLAVLGTPVFVALLLRARRQGQL